MKTNYEIGISEKDGVFYISIIEWGERNPGDKQGVSGLRMINIRGNSLLEVVNQIPVILEISQKQRKWEAPPEPIKVFEMSESGEITPHNTCSV